MLWPNHFSLREQKSRKGSFVVCYKENIMMDADSVSLMGIIDEDHVKHQQQQLLPTQTESTTAKKKRNLPGTPNPDAEIIALSPKTLMATNRFICEVCQKGFQREQNLQLHRRGHNLPWKLKQKSTKEVRRKVYLCPEPTCVHHEPSRALGDLTGIKKHFSRKHGEKKWKCEKCSKKYAVQSDWKAHSKTCGTREYKCDCGTLFSRRDSFITHRAFCDALAQESARLPSNLSALGTNLYGGCPNPTGNLNLSHQLNSQLSSLQYQSNNPDLLRLGGNRPSSNFNHLLPPSSPSSFHFGSNSQDFNNNNIGINVNGNQDATNNNLFHGLMQLPHHQDLQSNRNNNNSSSSSSAAANLFNLGYYSNEMNNSENSNLMNDNLPMSTNFNNNNSQDHELPQMSATALLQKAAQMGATTSGTGGTKMASIFKLPGFNSEENENDMIQTHNINDIMNSFANGNSTMFGGNSMGFSLNSGSNIDHDRGKFGANISDGLTRDFLGVGGIMRNLGGGGITQRDVQQHQQQQLDLEPQFKSSSSGRSFGGGSLQ